MTDLRGHGDRWMEWRRHFLGCEGCTEDGVTTQSEADAAGDPHLGFTFCSEGQALREAAMEEARKGQEGSR